MADVLFWLSVLATVGMVLIPLSYRSRGAALLGWFFQLAGGGVWTWTRVYYFPSWEEPDWSKSLIWVIASWLFFLVGFIIAIRKPRKRDLPVA